MTCFVKSATITPTGTFQAIQSAGTVSTGSIVAGAEGQVLILYNAVAQAITISDTGTIMLSANAVLNRYDTLTMLSDGTNWVELARSNN